MLRPKTIALPHRVDRLFLYRICNIVDPHYDYNEMMLGSVTIMEGIYREAYFLTLEGTSIGEKKLSLDPPVFIVTP